LLFQPKPKTKNNHHRATVKFACIETTMAKRKLKKKEEEEEEEESEWDDQGDSNSEELDYEDDSPDEAPTSARSKSILPPRSKQEKKALPAKQRIKTKQAPAKRPAAKKGNVVPLSADFLLVEEDDDDCPSNLLSSSARLTERGGYAHMNKSKLAISRANKGKQPWNKGKIRSGADKAKISAGVKARNRLILLDKIKRLGLSEEEWNQKKRQIKLLRERVRRKRCDNKEMEEEMRKNPGVKIVKRGPGGRPVKTVVSINESAEQQEQEQAALNASNDGDGDEQNNEEESEEESSDEEDDGLFPRDFRWTPHLYDEPETSYEKSCPTGGPGGLICCATCSSNYSRYLSATHRDMEEQKLAKMAGETKQLVEFLGKSKTRVAETIPVVRKKPPPLRRKAAPAAAK
jgi:hypothetical protein